MIHGKHSLPPLHYVSVDFPKGKKEKKKHADVGAVRSFAGFVGSETKEWIDIFEEMPRSRTLSIERGRPVQKARATVIYIIGTYK